MSEYNTDVAGMALFLQDRAIFEAPIAEVLELVKAEAERIAPRDTGDYASSFKNSVGVEPTFGGKFGAVPRVVGRVTNDSAHAGYVEYGNGRPGTRTNTMLRSLDAAHLR